MQQTREFIQDDLRVFVVPVDILTADLNIYQKMVYITLRSYCNAHNPISMPSYDEIANLSSISRRKAINVVKELVEKGLIEKKNRFTLTEEKKIENQSNMYTLKTPQPKETGSAQHALGGSAQHALGSAQHALGGSAQHAPYDIDVDIDIDDDDKEPPQKIFLTPEKEKQIYDQFKDNPFFSESMFKRKLALTKKHAKVDEVDYLKKSIMKQLEQDIDSAKKEQERQEEINNRSKGVKPIKHKNKTPRGSQSPKTIRKEIIPEWIEEQAKQMKELET